MADHRRDAGGSNPLVSYYPQRRWALHTQEKPVTTNTRPAFPDRDTTHVPTREECGEIVFQQIRSLMEDGHSQVLTREHAAEIAAYALKLLS